MALAKEIDTFKITGKTGADLCEITEALKEYGKSESLLITLQNGYLTVAAQKISEDEVKEIAACVQKIVEKRDEEYFAYGKGVASFGFEIAKGQSISEIGTEEFENGKLIDDLASGSIKNDGELPEIVSFNEGFWLTVLEKNDDVMCCLYNSMPTRLVKDEDFVKTALDKNIKVFGYIEHSFKTKELTEKAVAADINNVNFAPDEFVTIDLLKEAIKENKLILDFVPSKFRLENFTPRSPGDFDEIVAVKEKVKVEVDSAVNSQMAVLEDWFAMTREMPSEIGIKPKVTFDLETQNFEFVWTEQKKAEVDGNPVVYSRSNEDFAGFIETLQKNTRQKVEGDYGLKLTARQAERKPEIHQTKSLGR